MILSVENKGDYYEHLKNKYKKLMLSLFLN